MLAFTLEEAAVKGFMNRLLREDLFDAFEVRGVELYALTRVEISGEVEREYRKGNIRQFMTWGQMRPLVTLLVKSHEKPQTIKIVFSCNAHMNTSVHFNASALFINMTYEKGGVTFTTATSQKKFALDKTLDARWDEYVKEFFKQAGINTMPLR